MIYIYIYIYIYYSPMSKDWMGIPNMLLISSLKNISIRNRATIPSGLNLVVKTEMSRYKNLQGLLLGNTNYHFILEAGKWQHRKLVIVMDLDCVATVIHILSQILLNVWCYYDNYAVLIRYLWMHGFASINSIYANFQRKHQFFFWPLGVLS